MDCKANVGSVGSNERQTLMTRLLDAVKQCQIRFGGKTELATEYDSRITCLCAAWESVLQHGLKHSNKALSTLKQVGELTGLTRIGSGVTLLDDLRNMETEPCCWHHVKEHLSQHELHRYMLLRQVTTDAGRGRAWLRSALNEHSLEKYLHMFIGNRALLCQYYENWSFLCDEERGSMLPVMAAGLGSILFAIAIDSDGLNTIRAPTGLDAILSSSAPAASDVIGPTRPEEDQRPVIAGSPQFDRKRDKRKKKKKFVHIVSFDDGDIGSFRASSSVNSPCHAVHDAKSIPSVNTTDSSTLFSFSDDLTSGRTANVTPDVTSDVTAATDNGTDDGHATTSTQATNVGRTDGEADTDSDVNTTTTTTATTTTMATTTTTTTTTMTTPVMTTMPVSCDGTASVSSSTGKTNDGSICGTSLTSESSCSHCSLDVPPNSLIPLIPGEDKPSSIILFQGEDSVSCDSSDLPSYSEDTDGAKFALSLVQQGVIDSLRTQGDGSHAPDPISPIQHDTMTTGELKQAVIAMMMRKDEVEEQNSSLRNMLSAQTETSETLRAETDELRKSNLTKQNRDAEKMKTLSRENELLKRQLKKYVNAVQLLRRQSPGDTVIEGIHLDEVPPAIPNAKSHIDYSHEASEYEKKLIQVAEMHGELMEFNTCLQRQLTSRDALTARLRSELVDLRGPLPEDMLVADHDGNGLSDGDSGSPRPLVNVWIPSVFLQGSSDAYHVYQVYIRIRDEEWNVYRRYADFRQLHLVLKKKLPIIGSYEFPPKKAIGNKSTKFVEARRQKLQVYLRLAVNAVLLHDSQLSLTICKETLLNEITFFGDSPQTSKKSKEKSSKRGREGSGRECSTTAGRAPPAPPQYMGL